MTNTPSNSPSRRSFMKATGALAAGVALTGRSAAGAQETLARKGGSPAVTFPADRHTAVMKWPQYEPEDREIVLKILDMDIGRMYDHLPQLEKEWCEHNGVPFSKAHCNGTAALHSMYFATGFPPGTEIMVPSYTFYSVVVVMRFFGYVPVFIDIDPRTACFDVEDAARKLNKNVKAIGPMHSWGLPCEMDRICAFAKEHGLMVLEDAAHAHGASMQGKKMGAWGDMAIFSFQGTKPLPGIEGGMGTYQKREHFEAASVFGEYRDPPTLPADSPYRKYVGTALGPKLRIHPLGAALARRQLTVLDQRNALIAAQVRQLNDRICRLPGLAEPVCRKDQQRVYYSSNVLFFDEGKAGFSRKAMVDALKAEGVKISSGDYPEQHKNVIYTEAQWWHHKPVVQELPGTTKINAVAVNVGLMRVEAPELVDQYINAFEKVWAHRKELA
ncbi:MAG: aminotransferase class I/II-fold pyridoxal phosphate-dependent enzyme [Planctomycetes bacterium]|nr:aminotransferase class I/II-fold pyridoxal phosphate-dependent enzyme [Planctomycetota bacterium]